MDMMELCYTVANTVANTVVPVPGSVMKIVH